MFKHFLSLILSLVLVVTTQPRARADNAEAGFIDIAGLPCEAAVNKLYEEGIVAGIDSQTFGPNMTLTRAQMAAILVRAYGQEDKGVGKSFEDVPESHWACFYIAAASALEL